MADSCLDDFFAKKDKSKKKNKKFATSDQPQSGRKMEDRKVPEKTTGTKKEKEKTNSTTSGNSTSLQYQEQAEEEWGEVEEKEIDYSGLKIQNLQISELRDEEYDREKSEDYSEEGDQSGQRDGSGPWNRTGSAPTAPTTQGNSTYSEVSPESSGGRESRPVSERQQQPPSQTVDDSKPSTYCPPHKRGSNVGSGGGGGGSGPGGKSRNKTAPEIDSELHFPSLSSVADGASAKKKGERLADFERGFESVKRGSRTTDEAASLGPQLDLGNKFDALSQGETS